MKYIIQFILMGQLIACNYINDKAEQSKANESVPLVATSFENEILIKISCGEGCESSLELDSTKSLLTSRNYDVLCKNLLSANPIIQITSTIALETLKVRGKINISASDQGQINVIKNSKKACSICEGCTHHFTGIVTDLFEPTDSNGFVKSIKYKLGLL